MKFRYLFENAFAIILCVFVVILFAWIFATDDERQIKYEMKIQSIPIIVEYPEEDDFVLVHDAVRNSWAIDGFKSKEACVETAEKFGKTDHFYRPILICMGVNYGE